MDLIRRHKKSEPFGKGSPDVTDLALQGSIPWAPLIAALSAIRQCSQPTHEFRGH